MVLSGRNPVSDARVSVAGGRAGASARTGSDGRFRFPGQPAAPLELSVEAKGFVAARQTIPAGAADLELTVALLPAAFSETVTVAAARTEMRLADSAASVAVLSSAEVAAGAAPALDEAIRQVPGFSLFRRSDSRTANPTTQGVFLRGIGGSGGSRAAVFDDGVPLNDPFGGWIFWGRVPASPWRESRSCAAVPRICMAARRWWAPCSSSGASRPSPRCSLSPPTARARLPKALCSRRPCATDGARVSRRRPFGRPATSRSGRSSEGPWTARPLRGTRRSI